MVITRTRSANFGHAGLGVVDDRTVRAAGLQPRRRRTWLKRRVDLFGQFEVGRSQSRFGNTASPSHGIERAPVGIELQLQGMHRPPFVQQPAWKLRGYRRCGRQQLGTHAAARSPWAAHAAALMPPDHRGQAATRDFRPVRGGPPGPAPTGESRGGHQELGARLRSLPSVLREPRRCSTSRSNSRDGGIPFPCARCIAKLAAYDRIGKFARRE